MSGETFVDLLAPNLPAIRKLIRAKTRMPDYVDDLVQQTLMQAFLHRDQLRSHGKFKSWISSIAINEIRGFARRTQANFSLDALQPLVSSDRSTCPYTAYEEKERAEQLYTGLAELNDRDRDAIHLIDFAGIKLAEAANTLSVAPAALKSTHYRARQRLGIAVRAVRKGSGHFQDVSKRGRRRREE